MTMSLAISEMIEQHHQSSRPFRLSSVDGYAIESRAKELQTRSIKTTSQMAAIELAVSCIDLTTLEGSDTPGKVRSLCARARRPDPSDSALDPVAAVCIYPSLAKVAAEAVAGTSIKVAAVAGAFPSSLSSTESRLLDIRQAVAAGADEIDIVIDRGAFLAGRYAEVYDYVAASKEACGTAHLKTILEVGELGSYDQIRKASLLAMAAGSDFIKTSTGKVTVNATPENSLVMAEAIRDYTNHTGRQVGLKLAGGIRKAKQAWQYFVMINETLGPEWLSPQWFRFGASGLLNDLIMQRHYHLTGQYTRPTDLPVD